MSSRGTTAAQAITPPGRANAASRQEGDADRRRDLILWFFGSCVACLLALHPLSAALIGGVYLPADADSFYHGHRILDAVADPLRMYQFDPRIHAPEGSWITWPWAYDMLMTWIGHLAVYGFGVKQPLAVLAYVAPAWTFVNGALLLGITRQLDLTLPIRTVAMLCYACSPLTQSLHRVGMLDHHFVEYSFVLATVLSGLSWFRALDSWRRAAVMGLVLGMAPAFHNGLFILQLPVLAALAIRWLQGRPGALRAASVFAASLLLGTLLFLLPSEPFRRGMFVFELQSWFHLYVAACTGLLACLLMGLGRSAKSAALLVVTAALLLAVIYSQTQRADRFLTGRLVDLADMAEVKGVLAYLADRDFAFLNGNYSGLLWLTPAALALLCWRLRYRRGDADLYFAVASICGTALLLQQFRFENYGSFALYLPLCRLVEDARQRWPLAARRIATGLAAGAAGAYVPAVAQLGAYVPLGGSYDYQMTRGVYPEFARACQNHPGIVLADNADGHFISFHTQCAVIADDFIMTAQHEQKLLEADRLMRLPLAQVLRQAPYVGYIYVRRNDNVFASNCAQMPCAVNQGLRQELLLAQPPYPASLHLVKEIRVQRDPGHSEPLARLFEVLAPDPPSSSTP